MKVRIFVFYLGICFLVFVDSYLLSKPSFIGKIGLLIYGYNYLRSYPRTLLLVFCVACAVLIITMTIHGLMLRQIIRKRLAIWISLLLVLASVGLLVGSILYFSTGTYVHVGLKFRMGVFLLPVIPILIFGLEFLLILKYQELSTSNRIADNPPEQINP